MNKLEIINEYLEGLDISSLSADGFDDAIIGIHGEKIVYSTTKCIEILITRDKMNKEDAEEYFDFNVEGAYVGENTPIFVNDFMFYGL